MKSMVFSCRKTYRAISAGSVAALIAVSMLLSSEMANAGSAQEEASDFLAKCENSGEYLLMRQAKDCQCLAKKLVELREELGSSEPTGNLLIKLDWQCHSIPVIRKHKYMACMKGWETDIREENFCACYSNHYADAFGLALKGDERGVRLSENGKSGMKANARFHCGQKFKIQ